MNSINYRSVIRSIAIFLSVLMMIFSVTGCGVEAPVTSGQTDETQLAIDLMSDPDIYQGTEDMTEAPDAAEDISQTSDTDGEDLEGNTHNTEIAGDHNEMNTKYDRHGALHVNNKGKLVDHNGEIVALHGYSTHGINLYDKYVNREFLKYMRDEWKIDIIRLAMYTTEQNGYCIAGEENKQRLLDVIDDGVRAATELGLYVIIDWHILSDSNPKIHEDQAVDFFDKVSAKYASYGNVFYEICNEPNRNCTWEDVREYCDRVIPVIRKNDQYSVILIGTPSWCQKLNEAVSEPVTSDDNIMYCLHFYADTHRDDLRRVCEDALKADLPIFVSEFGTCSADGNGAHNSDEADKWIRLLNDNDISYVMWNISNKNETSAMLQPGVESATGPYSDSDLRDPAKWYKGVLADAAAR